MSYDGAFKYDKEVAENYDSDRMVEEHWYFENEYVQKRYLNKKLERLLDIPVGTGRFLKYYHNVDSIVGIDISENMLDQAKTQQISLALNITLNIGDAFNLPYPDNYFDDVVCFRLLHLIPCNMRPKLLIELSRVCKKELVLQVYMNKPITMLMKIKHKLNKLTTILKPQTVSKWGHIEAFPLTDSEFSSLISECNLSIASETCLCDYTESKIYVFCLSKKA